MLFSENAFCDTESDYQLVRAEYRGLVIEDPEVKDLDRWERVREKLNTFLRTNSDDKDYTPRALYLLSRLHEQKSKILSDKQELDLAARNFKNIVEDYSNDDLVDDALLGLARISQRSGDLNSAKVYLQRILSDYGSSDSAQHAQRHFSEIEEQLLLSNVNKDNGDFKNSQILSNQPVLIGSLENSMPLVMIDAGHGGSEDGAIGPGGIKEKEIALSISFILKDLLRETGRVRVSLTRADDDTLTLADRTKMANEQKADLFVSIHANASEYKTSKGVETYYLDNTDDKSSLRLAQRENFTLQGPQDNSLAFIVSDFIQGVKMDDSISLAHLIQDNLVDRLKKENPQIKNLGVKKAPFYVLVGAHMPCILTEVSFIDHPTEGRMLGTLSYQRAVAQGVFDGIVSFLKKKSKF